jgi:polyisoprenyl-phosphate glycosyltransferase
MDRISCADKRLERDIRLNRFMAVLTRGRRRRISRYQHHAFSLAINKRSTHGREAEMKFPQPRSPTFFLDPAPQEEHRRNPGYPNSLTRDGSESGTDFMATNLSITPTTAVESAKLHTGTQILSVVCVLSGRETGFPSAFIELQREISGLGTPTELVAVLNCDGGDAVRTLRKLADRFDCLQVYVMKRRVDYATALLAGIENAIGDWVATIDVEADSPRVVGRLFESVLLEHAEVALSAVDISKRPLLDAMVSRLFHRVFRSLHGFSLASETPSARLLSRAVVNSLLCHDCPLVALETLAATGGYRKCVVPSEKRQVVRHTFGERARVRWRTLIGVNSVPLRLANLLCGISAVIALSYSLYVMSVYFIKHDVIPGWTTVSLMLSAMFMMLALVLWLLSEYMLMLLDPAARHPRYEIAEEFGSQLRPADNTLNVETEL